MRGISAVLSVHKQPPAYLELCHSICICLRTFWMVQCLGYIWDSLAFESRLEQETFLFSKSSSLAMGPTKLIQWVLEFLPDRWSSHSMKLSAHLHLVQMLRICGAVPPLPLYAFMMWTGTTVTAILCGMCELDISSSKLFLPFLFALIMSVNL